METKKALKEEVKNLKKTVSVLQNIIRLDVLLKRVDEEKFINWCKTKTTKQKDFVLDFVLDYYSAKLAATKHNIPVCSTYWIGIFDEAINNYLIENNIAVVDSKNTF